jgi:hypothetical protein
VAAAEGHGDAGCITTPISLKTGNRSLVQFFYPLALKVESTIGTGSPAVLVPMVGAFNWWQAKTGLVLIVSKFIVCCMHCCTIDSMKELLFTLNSSPKFGGLIAVNK